MERRALSTYGKQQVMTASPVELVAQLYDKAIVSLREAERAIEAGDVNARWKSNSKATEIVTHLANTLDYDNGGEVASNLGRLYIYCLDRLFEIDMKNDAQAARDVIGLLEPLRDSWRQLAEQPRPAAGAPAGQPAPEARPETRPQAVPQGDKRYSGRGVSEAYPNAGALREALNISA